MSSHCTCSCNVLSVCSCLIVGTIGQTVGWQFYQTPNLAAMLAGCLFAGFSAIPEHRLRITSRILCFRLPHFISDNQTCVKKLTVY